MKILRLRISIVKAKVRKNGDGDSQNEHEINLRDDKFFLWKNRKQPNGT